MFGRFALLLLLTAIGCTSPQPLGNSLDIQTNQYIVKGAFSKLQLGTVFRRKAGSEGPWEPMIGMKFVEPDFGATGSQKTTIAKVSTNAVTVVKGESLLRATVTKANKAKVTIAGAFGLALSENSVRRLSLNVKSWYDLQGTILANPRVDRVMRKDTKHDYAWCSKVIEGALSSRSFYTSAGNVSGGYAAFSFEGEMYTEALDEEQVKTGTIMIELSRYTPDAIPLNLLGPRPKQFVIRKGQTIRLMNINLTGNPSLMAGKTFRIVLKRDGQEVSRPYAVWKWETGSASVHLGDFERPLSFVNTRYYTLTFERFEYPDPKGMPRLVPMGSISFEVNGRVTRKIDRMLGAGVKLTATVE